MSVITHLRTWMRDGSSSATTAVSGALSGSVEDFVQVRSREFDRWFAVLRIIFGLGVLGYLSVDVMQHAVSAASMSLPGCYLAINLLVVLLVRRRPHLWRWAFAGLDVALVVMLRHAFSFELLVDPNATMVGFFTLVLLLYTAYGDPILSRVVAIGAIVATSVTLCLDLTTGGAMQTGVFAYQRYPLRLLVILVYLGSFCLVTYALALKLREYVLSYGLELHRRVEAAMMTTVERTRREELEELNRLKRDFISILSHELRTPLAPLRSSLELIRDRSDSFEEDCELLGIALESTGKLQRLVQDYTHLAELLTCEDAGMIRWNLRVSTLIDALREQGGMTRVDADVLEGLVVVADPRLLAGALLALIRRASLVSSPTSRISLQGYATDRDVILEIHDAESYLERDISEMLDDPFVLSSERTFVSANTGLELILARHSLHRIGGKLRVTSDRRRGTTISCAVPPMQHDIHWLSDAQLRFELEPLRLHTVA